METDSITAPDVEEAAMRDLGVETDAAQGRAASETSTEMPQERATEPVEASLEETPPLSPSPETERPQSPEIPEPRRDAPQQRPRDPATGKFQRPDTEYSRAQKEQERRDRSWQALQAEKEQFRQYQSQFQEQQRMAQLEQARRQYQPLKRDGLTAKEYYDGAMVFEREGDYENAYKAHRVAQEMFQAEQGRAQQMQGVEAEYQWRMGMQQAIAVEPKIADPDSPISQHLSRIIEQNPWIYHIPQGFQRAAEVAHMLTRMAEMKEKDDEIISLKAELEKHQRRGQPARGGHATPRYGEKDFDEMNLDEQEAHLKHLTAEADTWR